MSIDSIERELFFRGIYLKYGYDFSGYSEASIDRRLTHVMERLQIKSLLGLLEQCLASPAMFREILPNLTINTTEFFRDPEFFKSLREKVFPFLSTYPEIRIWVAGCSSGEEVLSLCIALREEGLLKRSQIFATDINPQMLAKAKAAIYDSAIVAKFNAAYSVAGGTQAPSSYYTCEYGLVQFDRTLLDSVTFLDHNMVTDDVFLEAHLILCRNVLIYFNKSLQEKVVTLFARSLCFKGFLGIGPKETLRFSKAESYFEKLDPQQNIFMLRATTLTP